MNWEFKRTAFQKCDKAANSWWRCILGSEIRHINGKYVLYFSWAKWGDGDASYTAVATSDSPLGDFVNSKEC